MKHKLENAKYLNAPTLAYYARTGKVMHIGGRSASHVERQICGDNECANIDSKIPEEPMKKLLSIDKIDMRSSCSGVDDLYGPFFIFRLIGINNESTINSICDKLNDDRTYCKYGLGREDKFRIIVVGTRSLNNKTGEMYNEWWADIIDKLLNII